MVDREEWGRTRPRTQEDWDALLDAKREKMARSERMLAELVHEACPGVHTLRVHRDSRPPWCDWCGRGARGVRVSDQVTDTPAEPTLEVLVVSFKSGVVHRWQCDQAPTGADALGWSPRMAGHDDEACGFCLPEGLPR